MGESGVQTTASWRQRFGQRLASPLGVLLIFPLLVIATGVAVMLFGRNATHDVSNRMAIRQLASHSSAVAREVAIALDQAEPILERMRDVADAQLAMPEVARRLRDLHVGRPGVTNLSIGFPSGVMRGTFFPKPGTPELQVQESVLSARATVRTDYRVDAASVTAIGTSETDYDVRTRPQYVLAVQAGGRTWTPPKVYFTSSTTGINCAEPIYAADGTLKAVISVGFDVDTLSRFIGVAPIDGARTVALTGDGTVLAFPGATVPSAATREQRLVKYSDFADPVLDSLFATIRGGVSDHRFVVLHTSAGDQLASVAPIGRRAGVAAPLDWYIATLLPERTLLGPGRRLAKQTVLVSAGAVAIAVGVALLFAWNLLRMRRAIRTARERARSAEERARELGSYRLVSRLGAGGMGEVWRAEHTLLARAVAIKLVRQDTIVDAADAIAMQERFKREAQTLASMHSRNTIALYDYGITDEGTFYYVMELLDGVDLEKLLLETGLQPAARVIAIMTQVCHSLAEAHEAGLIHRDIKPANIALCRVANEVDVVKVLDFGIVSRRGDDDVNGEAMAVRKPNEVSASGRLTHANAIVGTPGFLPPEQATGGRSDPRGDIYALACVAWWLLTGREVFARNPDDDNAILVAHIKDPVPKLSEGMTSWLPAELETLITRCLAKKPEDRPDARELARALRAIVIPAEHAWTEEKALTWWSTYRPTSAAASSEAVTQQQVLITSPAQRHANATATIQARRS